MLLIAIISNHCSHPSADKLSNVVKVPLYPEKDTPIDLNIKAFVGHPGSSQFHVFEASRALPRFTLYVPCETDIKPTPKGSLTFNLSERLDRVGGGGEVGQRRWREGGAEEVEGGWRRGGGA